MSLNRIDTLIETVSREFKAGVRAEVLSRLQAQVAPELEAIATAEAERIYKFIVDYWRDDRLMVDWIGMRLSINGTEVTRVDPT